MRSDWQETSIAEITDSCLGKMLDQKKNRGNYQPYLANVNVRWGSFTLNNLPQMRFEDFEDERYGLQYGDIVLCEGGEPGRCAIWRNELPNMKFQKALHRIRVRDGVSNEFLYYWFLLAGKNKTLHSYFTGTTIQHLPGDKLKSIRLCLPPYKYQQRVASILRSLDEKIELNNRINENLQQQAQAIFKSWFVDFEPFGGVMPDDWHIGTFSDIIERTIGGDWGKETPTGNNTEKVYCIRGADIPDVKAGNKGKMPTRYILPKNFTAKQLMAGDIVVEISGGSPTQSTGRSTAISQSLLDRYDQGMICTNFCRAIKPFSGYSLFIYFYWQYLYEKGVFFSYENGTTGIKNLDISGFLSTERIVIPTQSAIKEFDQLCQVYFGQIFANGYQSEKLAELRDSLLPKLMSGELDVSEVNI